MMAMQTYHTLLSPRDQESIIVAGAKAAALRNDPIKYAAAVQEIDSAVAIIRSERPEKFWAASDPAYQAMAAKWERDRQARAAEFAAKVL